MEFGAWLVSAQACGSPTKSDLHPDYTLPGSSLSTLLFANTFFLLAFTLLLRVLNLEFTLIFWENAFIILQSKQAS